MELRYAIDGSILIDVIDQGVGIAQQDMDKLYTKFSCTSNPLSVQRGGTGLGLYWAREILQMHNGSVTARPNKDANTIFTIALPHNS